MRIENRVGRKNKSRLCSTVSFLLNEIKIPCRQLRQLAAEVKLSLRLWLCLPYTVSKNATIVLAVVVLIVSTIRNSTETKHEFAKGFSTACAGIVAIPNYFVQSTKPEHALVLPDPTPIQIINILE